MMIKKICEICGTEFEVPHWREKTAKYCSRKCSDESHKSKDLNCTCPICGKAFHVKPYHLKKYGHSLGNYCSRKCLTEARKEIMKGAGNHQYGLKGHLNASHKEGAVYVQNHKLLEKYIYCENHPFCKAGRVLEHRLVVEQNYQRFDKKYFVNIDGVHYLAPKIEVHHKDGDHTNNNIDNLVPCTKKEHRQFHKSIITERDNLGRIVKTAVVKQGELLGSSEVGNQQPSQI